MTKVYDPRNLLLVALLAVCTSTVHAGWQLVSDQSQLSYTTTKVIPGAEKSAAENNRFAKLEGEVGDNGTAEVRILLDSVNTNVAIRDERMRDRVSNRKISGCNGIHTGSGQSSKRTRPAPDRPNAATRPTWHAEVDDSTCECGKRK